MKYVLHFCKNKDCNNGWLDKDLTNCKDRPPRWKYCKECCKKLGIDFNKQEKPEKEMPQGRGINENLENQD